MTLQAGFGEMTPAPFDERVYVCLDHLMGREFPDRSDLLWHVGKDGFKVIHVPSRYGFHVAMNAMFPVAFTWVLFSAEPHDPFGPLNIVLVDQMGPFWGTLGKMTHWPTYTLGDMGRIWPSTNNPEEVRVYPPVGDRRTADEVASLLVDQLKECGIDLLAGNRAIMSQCDACPRQLACAAIKLPTLV